MANDAPKAGGAGSAPPSAASTPAPAPGPAAGRLRGRPRGLAATKPGVRIIRPAPAKGQNPRVATAPVPRPAAPPPTASEQAQTTGQLAAGLGRAHKFWAQVTGEPAMAMPAKEAEAVAEALGSLSGKVGLSLEGTWLSWLTDVGVLIEAYWTRLAVLRRKREAAEAERQAARGIPPAPIASAGPEMRPRPASPGGSARAGGTTAPAIPPQPVAPTTPPLRPPGILVTPAALPAGGPGEGLSGFGIPSMPVTDLEQRMAPPP